MVCNYGLVNGLSRKDVLQVFSQYGHVERVIMVPQKSYCFICYSNVQEAITAYDEVNGKMCIFLEKKLFYLIYTNSGKHVCYCFIMSFIFKFSLKCLIAVPTIFDNPPKLPPGLEIIDNFITETEEHLLLTYFDKHWSKSSKFLKSYK